MRSKKKFILIGIVVLIVLFAAICKKKKDKYEITITPVNIQDSKCNGGISSQEIKVKNISNQTQKVLPYCEVELTGVEIVNPPKTAKTIEPGKSDIFTCGLRDFDDPPDGTKKGVTVKFTVTVNGQKESKDIPVVCEDF